MGRIRPILIWSAVILVLLIATGGAALAAEIVGGAWNLVTGFFGGMQEFQEELQNQ